jgi:hypothetical protein
MSGNTGYHFSRNPRTWGCVCPDDVVEIDQEREILPFADIQGPQGQPGIPGPYAFICDERELPATENPPPDKYNPKR